jgi:hypothetical protein
MPGSLAAFGLVHHKEADDQFFSNVTFTDPTMLHSSSTVFDGVPVGAATLLSSGSYTPELSLTNFSAEDQQVQIHYSQTSAGAATIKDLASFKLAANTTRKMIFENLQGDSQPARLICSYFHRLSGRCSGQASFPKRFRKLACGTTREGCAGYEQRWKQSMIDRKWRGIHVAFLQSR